MYHAILVRCKTCGGLFCKKGIATHYSARRFCRPLAQGAPATRVPPTPQPDSLVFDTVMDNIHHFKDFPWAEYVHGRIHTTADLTLRAADEQAKPVLDAISAVLHGAFERKESQTVDYALKALVALLLCASHVSTNTIVQSESTTFETPNPKNVAKTIKQAIREFRNGRGHILFKAVLEASKRAQALGSLVSKAERQVQVAQTAISLGNISKGLRILDSHGLAIANDVTLKDIQDTYYPEPSQRNQDEFKNLLRSVENTIKVAPNEALYAFKDDDLEKAIKGLGDTAADLLGLRSGHIKKLLDLGHINLVNFICTNFHRCLLPKETMDILRGGVVVPIVKNPDENTIRPIAITSIISKISEQTGLKKAGKAAMSNLIEPTQFGYGHSSATEKTGLLVRAALLENPTHGVVQYDLKNAYGLMSRALVLRALIALGNKDLIRAFYTRYHTKVVLWMHMENGDLEPVEVTTGLLQGDPLAPLFFSLGFHIILRRLYNDGGTDLELMTAFLDDLNAAGEINFLSWLTKRFVAILEEERSGLVINWKKTFIFCPTSHVHTTNNPPPWTMVAPDKGIKVLGAYIGTPGWVQASIAKDFKETAELLTTIKRLPTQHATLVLRMCIVQRFNFIQRHTPPSLYKDTAKKMHDLIYSTAFDIFHIDREDDTLDLKGARMRLENPLRYGGFGMTDPVQFRLEAFLAGVGDSIDDLKASHPRQYNFIVNELLLKAYLPNDPANQVIDRGHFHHDVHRSLGKVRQNIEEGRTLGLLKDMSDDELKKTFPSTATQLLQPHRKLQRTFTNLAQDIVYKRFYADLDDKRQALNLSESSPGASSFLYAVPCSANLFMPDETFRVAARDRLGLPPLNGPVPECTNPNCSLSHASTHDDADSAARELRRHRHGIGACARHARVVKQITEMFRAANIPSTVEPMVRRPDLRGDIAETRTNGHGYKTIYDVSITETTRSDTLSRAAKTAGAAAAETKKYKNNKYLGACKAINAHFYPLIFETSGFIDKSVFDLIAQISSSLHNQAEHIPEFTTWAAPTFKHYWLQRISIAVRGGSAEMSVRNWKQRLGGQAVGF